MLENDEPRIDFEINTPMGLKGEYFSIIMKIIKTI